MDLPEGFEVVSTPEVTQEIPEGFEVDQNFFQKIDQALQKVPGIPQLTEFAAATNRSVADVIDFIGPDTINAALQVSGSEMRVPTLRGSLEKTGIEGGFVEPGLQREVIQAAGAIKVVFDLQ